MTIQLKREYNGNIVLHVNGQPAAAAKFGGIQPSPDGMQAVFIISMQHVVMGEIDNVVPFVAPQARS